jgi:hypothetical protein
MLDLCFLEKQQHTRGPPNVLAGARQEPIVARPSAWSEEKTCCGCAKRLSTVLAWSLADTHLPPCYARLDTGV